MTNVTFRQASEDPEGEPLELEPEQVALVEAGGELRRLGGEHPVFLAWWEVLREEVCAELEEQFEQYLRTNHVSECQRLLLEARALGLEPDRARALDARLSGKV